MKLLAIPLIALTAFVLCLTYIQFNSDVSPENGVDWPLGHSPEAHQHETAQHKVPHGKPAAAITLISEGVQAIELMNSTQLELVLKSQVSDGIIDIRLKVDEALQLLSTTTQWSFDPAENSQLVLPIEVIAQRNGNHYVHLFIDHHALDGTHTARALAVEIKVGNLEEFQLFSKHSSPPPPSSATTSLKAEEEIF